MKYQMLNIVAGLMITISMILNSCSGQSGNTNDCTTHLKSAKLILNTYYKTNDSSSLPSALANAEYSTQCDKTKMSAVKLKLSLLALMKKYGEGFIYTDSLRENDFVFPYKKKMWHDYFGALNYESQHDTLNRNRLFNDISGTIEDYLQKNSFENDKINEEAYYDLLFVKSKFLPYEQVRMQIDSLEQKYPKSLMFFESVKGSIDKEQKNSTVEAITK